MMGDNGGAILTSRLRISIRPKWVPTVTVTSHPVRKVQQDSESGQHFSDVQRLIPQCVDDADRNAHHGHAGFRRLPPVLALPFESHG
jgi:hypothetical protein